MNSLIFCAILSLSSSLAFKVTFHPINLENNTYVGDAPLLSCTRHEFIYHRGDAFTLLINVTTNSYVTISRARAVVKYSGVMDSIQTFWSEDKRTRCFTVLNFKPKSDKLSIDVELSSNNTCVRQTILEGREVPRTLQEGTNITAVTNHFQINDICIKKNRCAVLVYPNEECEEGNLTPLPCENGHYVQVVAPADDQRSKTANETKSNPETSRAKDDSKEGAENSYFIIMIVTSITSAVALILLLVIAIRKNCWIHSPPSILHVTLPRNEDPFYENVHLRAGCPEVIKELEQRAC